MTGFSTKRMHIVVAQSTPDNKQAQMQEALPGKDKEKLYRALNDALQKGLHEDTSMTVTFCGVVYFPDEDFLEFVQAVEMDEDM
jgi:hypothetical protein